MEQLYSIHEVHIYKNNNKELGEKSFDKMVLLSKKKKRILKYYYKLQKNPKILFSNVVFIELFSTKKINKGCSVSKAVI